MVELHEKLTPLGSIAYRFGLNCAVVFLHCGAIRPRRRTSAMQIYVTGGRWKMQDFENKGSSAEKQGENTGQKENSGASGSMDLQSGGGGAKGGSQSSPILTKVKDTASEAYSSVADGAAGLIDEKKGELTSGLTGIAQTVRRVSEAITGGEESSEGLKGSASTYVETAAAKLEGVADYFDNHDLRAMAGDVQNYARRNPAIFLGGAFVVGVLAARFLKSKPTSSNAQGGNGGGGGQSRSRRQTRSRSSSETAGASA